MGGGREGGRREGESGRREGGRERVGGGREGGRERVGGGREREWGGGCTCRFLHTVQLSALQIVLPTELEANTFTY